MVYLKMTFMHFDNKTSLTQSCKCAWQGEVSLLRTEVTRLKELLLAHKDCPVTALQKKAYLGRSINNHHSPNTRPTYLLYLSEIPYT